MEKAFTLKLEVEGSNCSSLLKRKTLFATLTKSASRAQPTAPTEACCRSICLGCCLRRPLWRSLVRELLFLFQMQRTPVLSHMQVWRRTPVHASRGCFPLATEAYRRGYFLRTAGGIWELFPTLPANLRACSDTNVKHASCTTPKVRHSHDLEREREESSCYHPTVQE